jgi:energy-converting hydrogenase Eha subunit B
MSQLTTEQLVKIIIGVLVFVAVIVGVFLFFRFKVIDFFKGYTDDGTGEQTQGGTEGETPQLKVPTEILKKVQKLCGYCTSSFYTQGVLCSKEECEGISNLLNLGCQFVKGTINGNCLAISTGVSYEGRIIPSRLCEDCGSAAFCTEKECSGLNSELTKFGLKCIYTPRKILALPPTPAKCTTTQL